MWLAEIVGPIEDEERMQDFRVEGMRHNPYREQCGDHDDLHAFGCSSLSKGYDVHDEQWTTKYGALSYAEQKMNDSRRVGTNMDGLRSVA